ncbi:MAG: hypothetical protein JNL81_01725 [Hyphomonadaceae bacterium]|nr:hypothetical protein [Hyphomonadaceae bacterium]
MIRCAGHELVPKLDAEGYVRELTGKGIRILGIEAFVIDGDQIVPQMDLIADFSGSVDVQSSLVDALSFLRRDDDRALYFYFTT